MRTDVECTGMLCSFTFYVFHPFVLPFVKPINYRTNVCYPKKLSKYRTRAIITRGLYIYYPIFHSAVVDIVDWLV
jgi:hypothetical protein